ncbi:hypothetical protein BVRB_4g072210 [Beta vulgaris subsp. vulgaris]|nr:hypothetical protein BVRB_4g072210 [Beta vulgaris subsp. vulgaris]
MPKSRSTQHVLRSEAGIFSPGCSSVVRSSKFLINLVCQKMDLYC